MIILYLLEMSSVNLLKLVCQELVSRICFYSYLSSASGVGYGCHWLLVHCY